MAWFSFQSVSYKRKERKKEEGMDGKKMEGRKERREGGSKETERKRRESRRGNRQEGREGVPCPRSQISDSSSSRCSAQHAFPLLPSAV